MNLSRIYFLLFFSISVLVGNFLILKIKDFETDLSLFQSSVFLPKRKPIVLFFVGDIMLDRGVELMIEKEGKGDYKFPFLKIAHFLERSDILFGNLEGPLSDKGKRVGSIYSFRMKPEAIEGLKFAGFDILSLANNHLFDYGREALEDTFKRLKKAKIDFVGGGLNKKEACLPKIKKIKKTKIAFLAFTNLGTKSWEARENQAGICWLEKENLKEYIKKAKNSAHLVIVSLHFGEEYQTKATFSQKYFASLAIDFGADLVVGHHPHVIQEIEKYKGKYIIYSLGNFVFDQNFSKKTMEGLLLKVLIGGNKIKEVLPIKIKINNFFQPEIIKN